MATVPKFFLKQIFLKPVKFVYNFSILLIFCYINIIKIVHRWQPFVQYFFIISPAKPLQFTTHLVITCLFKQLCCVLKRWQRYLKITANCYFLKFFTVCSVFLAYTHFMDLTFANTWQAFNNYYQLCRSVHLSLC